MTPSSTNQTTTNTDWKNRNREITVAYSNLIQFFLKDKSGIQITVILLLVLPATFDLTNASYIWFDQQPTSGFDSQSVQYRFHNLLVLLRSLVGSWMGETPQTIAWWFIYRKETVSSFALKEGSISPFLLKYEYFTRRIVCDNLCKDSNSMLQLILHSERLEKIFRYFRK